MRTYRKIFFFIMALAVASACKKPTEYPIIPAIDFKRIGSEVDVNGRAQNVIVTIGCTDGDGDIGYYSVESGKNDPKFDIPADTTNPYYYNFKVKAYKRVNNAWQLDPIDIGARIPYLTPEGSNKALKCEIERELPVPPGLVNDTFYYEIFIWDRSLHASNTIKTDPIILTTQ